MKKLSLIAVFAAVFASFAAAQAPVIPLEGLDPVALVQGRQEEGDKKLSITRGHFQYVFANAANKAAFEKDPERYAIQLDGSCARMGGGVSGNPDSYFVYEGKIYIFGSEGCYKAFKATPDKFLASKQPALPAWSVTPQSAAAGHKLLDRAVTAMGGAYALDGLTAYQDVRERNKETRTFVYPDRFHVERTFNEQFHAEQTLVGTDGFASSPRGTQIMSATAVADQQRNNRRELLLLLRARNDKDFRAAAIDANSVDVEWMGDRSTLVFDPNTGLVSALKFRGRTGSGFGELTLAFSDYRKVGTLTLPYHVKQSFENEADSVQDITITAIALNPQIPASMFQKPDKATTDGHR
jgi:YHS domain-containing protein